MNQTTIDELNYRKGLRESGCVCNSPVQWIDQNTKYENLYERETRSRAGRGCEISYQLVKLWKKRSTEREMNGTGGDEKMYRTTNSDRQKPCPVCAKRDERRAHLKEWATHAAKAGVYATFQVGITLSVLFAVGSGLITLPW